MTLPSRGRRTSRSELRPLRSSRCALLALLLLLEPAGQLASWGQATAQLSAAGSAQLAAKLQQRGDLTLRNTPLSEALFTISHEWQISLVTGQQVEGEVNCNFKQAPLADVLGAVLLSGGYGYQVQGDSLIVLPLNELGESNPLFETAAIAVQNLNVQELVEAARIHSSPKGKVQAVPAAQSLLVVDYADRVERIRRLIALLDAPSAARAAEAEQQTLQPAYFQPSFVDVKRLGEALSATLSPEGKVAVLQQESRVLMVDHPQNLAMAERVLRRIDLPREQVRISAYIYDISLEDMEQLGVNWSNAVKDRINAGGDAQSLMSIDSLTRVPFAPNAAGAALTFLNMSRHFDLTATVTALSNAKDSRLLADPNIVVLDNEPATISIISEIPFQQLTETAQGGNIGTTAFREAGVKLQVTPRIAADGTIQLDVVPEFSRLTGFTPEDNQPIIDRRTARTTVRIVNGHTLVIGGLRTRTDLGDFNGIPLLKDLPGVGILFRGRETSVRESELVVFIRPEIVSEAEPLEHRTAAAYRVSEQYLGSVPLGDVGCVSQDGPVLPAEEMPPRHPPRNPPLPPETRSLSSRPPSRPLLCRLPPVETQRQPARRAGQRPTPVADRRHLVQRIPRVAAQRAAAQRSSTPKTRDLHTKPAHTAASSDRHSEKKSWLDTLFRF